MVEAAEVRRATAIRGKARRTLVLACGNTCRGDDGTGWEIANAIARNPPCANLEIVRTRQLLPEHAAFISEFDLVLFLDCSVATPPGSVSTTEIKPAEELPRVFTHHLEPASLLTLAHTLYQRIPSQAIAVTIGGAAFEHSEKLSNPVTSAIPLALKAVRKVVTGRSL